MIPSGYSKYPLEHSLQPDGFRIKFSVGNAGGIIRKILVAEQNPVLVNPGGEQPHPAFKPVVDTDAHGGCVPVVPVLTLNGVKEGVLQYYNQYSAILSSTDFRSFQSGMSIDKKL